MTYKRIVWEIDIFDSETDREAIEEAMKMFPVEGNESYAGVFTVKHFDGNSEEIAERDFDIQDEEEIEIGDFVNVAPADGDDFNEFTGRVEGFRGKYITVIDGDNDAFDVHPWQATKREE